MTLEKVLSELSEIERKALKALSEAKKELNAEDLAKRAGMDIDSARRSMQWLKQKNLAETRTEKKEFILLGEEGLKALREGLPEKKLAKELNARDWKAIEEIKSLGKDELNISLGQAKRKQWIEVKKEGTLKLKLTQKGFNALKEEIPEEKLLKKISNKELPLEQFNAEEKNVLKEFQQRKDFIRIKEKKTGSASITEQGMKGINLMQEKGLKIQAQDDVKVIERHYNIQEPVPEIFPGKKQPYLKFLDEMKRKLIELGFKEMPSPLIVQEFYNFDVLFQPQNHPARDWTQTYQLKRPQFGLLPDKKIVEKMKAAHENGGISKSRGWQYNWSERIASRLMPCAHGTAHSARQLVKGVELPGKYFSIARCFRPDVVDATHLIEFNQLEGFIVDSTVTFRHLLGMLKEFAEEIAGAEKIKFIPDYYPFTEPSVQLNALHPEMGWIEFGGAGIFRPEITENLGIKGRALAWGIGADRLAMFKLGINDARDLFSYNLDWLKRQKVMVE
ncbi:MAG: phenylalanine--tRNA ligase subunit alpha [Candidatus Diapherotrites archaeon]